MEPLAGCGARGWMVRLNCGVAWRRSLSVTFIVKTNVPAVVGVPDSWLPMMAGAFGELSARPGGSWPEATDQVIGAGAVEATKECSGKEGTPSCPAGSGLVLALGSGSGADTRALEDCLAIGPWA